MSTMAPLTLFRSLLREAKHMSDYNFRSYAIRRVKIGFQKNKSLQGEQATVALKEGEVQLGALKRQAVVGQLFPSSKSVMDME